MAHLDFKPAAALGDKRVVALVSVLAAVALTALKAGVGLATGSLGLFAEAAHSALDTVAALIGVWIGEQRGETALWSRADALAALGVSGIVVLVAGRLARETIDALLDRAPIALGEAIAAAARAVPGVLDARRLRLRRVGGK